METELKEIKQNVVISMEKKIDELKASLLVMFYVKVQLGHLYSEWGKLLKRHLMEGNLQQRTILTE